MKTQKSILTVLALTLISLSSFAQVNLGLRTGAAVSTFASKGDLLDNTNVTLSYTVGAFATMPIGSSFAVQPEINYVRKGRNEETSELNTTSQVDYMVHYLQVPVLMQYRDENMLGKKGSIFYVSAGPYAAFALNNQTRPSNSIQVTYDKKTDWGASFGIGIQTPICSKNIRFDLRYDMGLAEIANQPTDYRTKALSLTVGIAL